MEVSRASSPPTLQELVGAAERLKAREHGMHGVAWLPLVEEALHRLRAEPFAAPAIPAFRMKTSGKERVIASPEPTDRLIEEALLPRLETVIGPLLSDAVHSYRKGRSTFTAATAAMRGLLAGSVEIAQLDVQDYFSSIDRGRLRERLTVAADPWLAGIAAALVAAPLRLDGQLVTSSRGIPLGRPISPILANFYLIDLDRAMNEVHCLYLRYGDDLFLAAPTAEGRAAAERAAAGTLAGLGLCLNESKSAVFRYDGRPFVYLGHLVSGKGVYEKVSDERLERIVTRGPAPEPVAAAALPDHLSEHPNRRAQTLYVTEPGLYVSVSKGLVVLKKGSTVVREVPLRRIDRVLVLAGGSMSSGFLSACVESQIPAVFFVGRGRAFGSLVSGGMPNPLRLRAQYDLLSHPQRRLALARSLIRAKIEAMLQRLTAAAAAAEARGRLRQLATEVDAAPDSTILRGLEGAATKAYYEGFAHRIRSADFAYRGRSKRPPRDRLNSLLSFSYSLLFGEMQTALLAEGLDPYPGLLHDLNPAHPALASDLVEPYRALIADTFVLTLVNNARVGVADFEVRAGGAVYLRDEPRRTVLHAYETFLSRPGGRGRATPRQLLHAAARSMLRVVLGEREDLDLPLQAVAEDEAPAS